MSKRSFLLVLWIPALAVGAFGWLTYQHVQHQKLNSKFVRAITANDANAALHALDGGADPNTRQDATTNPSNLWELLRTIATSKHSDRGDPVLIMALGGGETVTAPIPEVALVLIHNGADPNVRCTDHPHKTALQLCAPLGAAGEEVAKSLLLHGATTGVRDGWRATALTDAVMNENINLARLLLSHGARGDEQDEDGTPLFYTWGNTAMVRLLLDAGADPRVRAKDGTTALHETCNVDQWRDGVKRTDPADAVELLLLHGADVNARDARGMTPLMYAAECHVYKTARALIRAGARIHVYAKDGRCPMSEAANRVPPDTALMNMIRQAGALERVGFSKSK